MYACTGTIQSKLSDRYTHAICPKITQSKYTLSICHDDDAHIFFGPVVQYAADPTFVLRRNIKALCMPKDVRKFPARLTHCGCIDQRHNLVYVLYGQPEKKSFISILKTGKQNISF